MIVDGLNNFDYTRDSTYRLVGLEQLMEILGYTSTKGLYKWCSQNKVPVVKLGRNSYVLAEHIDQVIENQLRPFMESLNDANSRSNITRVDPDAGPGEHSNAAQTFIDNVSKL